MVTYKEMNDKVERAKQLRKKMLLNAREEKMSIEQAKYDYYNSNTFEQICKDLKLLK